MIVGVEIILQIAESKTFGSNSSATWRNQLLTNIAFHDKVFEHIVQNRTLEPATIWPFFTYPFLHLNIPHVAIGAAIFIAMGKVISDSFSNLSVFLLFIGCTFSGALVFGIVSNQSFPLVGAYPAIYGFVSAYTWIEYRRLKSKGKSTWPAFRLILALLAIRTIFALIFGLRGSWSAELTGLATGFLLSFILAPDRPRTYQKLDRGGAKPLAFEYPAQVGNAHGTRCYCRCEINHDCPENQQRQRQIPDVRRFKEIRQTIGRTQQKRCHDQTG